MQEGKVSLVGAGPGDPGLITVRGLERLRQADVVVYDRLVSPELLRHVRPDAEVVYVGKQGGAHTMRQEEINRLLVDRGRSGKRVVRLKGGDPFVFGRGGEEALAVAEAGLPFEVVPGVTSAVAAPAYAGIPVTHRGVASSFAVVTGHEDPSKDQTGHRWEHLATGPDTLVFLMGVENLEPISQALLAHGRPPDTPAALVRWGTTPEQQVLSGSLGDILQKARESDFRPPAVLVVGEVVGLRDRLRWYDSWPLLGRRILVTRSREQASQLSEAILALGGRPIEFPTIRVVPLDDSTLLDAALERLASYDWVVLTSVNGVESVFARLRMLGKDARAFGRAKVCAIGPATADALSRHGICPDWVPTQFTSEAIARGFADLGIAGRAVLLLRADIAPPTLSRALVVLGARVDEVAAYRTVHDQGDLEAVLANLAEGRVHAVTFTSSSTVQNMVKALAGKVHLLRSTLVACIGPTTARTAQELGLEVGLVAREHTVPGLVRALVDHFAQDSRSKTQQVRSNVEP